MEDIRKQDPTFTNFVPRNAAEAVDRYVRCRRNGLKPMLVPECLIQCAVGLQGGELDKFEDWIINPNQDLYKAKLIPDDTIRLQNQKIYEENLGRVCRALQDAPMHTPPLPREPEMRMQQSQAIRDAAANDEKMETSSTEAVQGSMSLSPSSPCSMILT